jgi:quinolinate synthase
MEDDEVDRQSIDRILTLKRDLGERLIILTHHYQRREIVELGDYRGDSFGLSRTASADKSAAFIVFCGVHFMAESASILAQPHQTVQMPVVEAGCWMADMADIVIVQKAWEEITTVVDDTSIIPVVYMNAEADLKAFCGRRGGIVCTSSNAPAAFQWAFDRGEKILFFPDQHLGRNTGNQMGINPEEMVVWDPHHPMGGNPPERVKAARIILWDGYCLVHTRFRVDHIETMRGRYPDGKIVVHPECEQEVVNASDAVGSTSFIVNYVKDAPSGATIIVGTEINLIKRLALEHPDKQIVELHPSLCPNMAKTKPHHLLWTLENIGKVNVITVPEEIKRDAGLALDRMLMLEKR